MMRRRMVGRRVARAAVGTAVVVGTAGAVRHAEDQHYANQAAAQQAAQEPQVVYEQAPSGAAELDDQEAQLKKLADMKAQGLITEDEYNAKKKQVLGL